MKIKFIPCNTPRERLMRRIMITRDARFYANYRLMRRYQTSSYLIALMSLYVIGLSLFPNFSPIKIKDTQGQLLLAMTIVLSVFIIIVSMAEGAQNFFHRAEKMLESGRQLSHLVRKLDVIDENSVDFLEQVVKIGNFYDEILNDCQFNHDAVDYIRVVALSPNYFPEHYSEVMTISQKFHRIYRLARAVIVEFASLIFVLAIVSAVSLFLFFWY